MKASGLMICKKVMEKRLGKMALSMRANIDKDKSMVMVGTYGATDQPMLVTGLITKSTDQVSTPGQINESTQECGKKTRCMDMDILSGQMVVSTKENL